MSGTNIRSVVSERAPEPVGPFPHAKVVGNLVFVSGIGPRTRGSKQIPGVTLDAGGNILAYDFETQCRAVFENVRMVVEDAGSRWDLIVDVTSFLTNMQADFAVYNRLFGEYFSESRPARTTVEVSRLPTPIAIELKVVAVLG
jgi:2-aminomuconate deaminase